MEQTNEYISRAIEEAKGERDQLLAKLQELDLLKKRLSQIETFIESGKAIIGGREDPQPIDNPSNGVSTALALSYIADADTDKPIHLRIIDLLRETGSPMTLREIVDEFHKRGWKLSPKNGKEVLRNTIKNKPHLFTKNENFQYFLKSYGS